METVNITDVSARVNNGNAQIMPFIFIKIVLVTLYIQIRSKRLVTYFVPQYKIVK